MQNAVVLGCFLWNYYGRKTYKKQLQETIESSEVVSEIVHSNPYIQEDKMEIVPVEEKMNQVAQSAPSEIGHVYESEIDTTEENTSSEVNQDSENMKHKEQTEEYEAKGTAKLIGTSGQTVSTAEAKSKQSESMTEAVEGDRKEEPDKLQESKPPPECNGNINDNPSTMNGTPPIITTTNTFKYKPLPPIKPFELLKPFEPPSGSSIKPFEPLKPFEPPKSFEIAKQICALDSANQAKPELPSEGPTKANEDASPLDSFNLKQIQPSLPVKSSEPIINLNETELPTQQSIISAVEAPQQTVEAVSDSEPITQNSMEIAVEPPKAYELFPSTLKSFESAPSSEPLNHYQPTIPLDPPKPFIPPITLEPLNSYQSTPYVDPPKSYEPLDPPKPCISPITLEPLNSYQSTPYVEPPKPYEPQLFQPTIKPFGSVIRSEPFTPYQSSIPSEPTNAFVSPSIKPFETTHSVGFNSYQPTYSIGPSQPYQPQLFQPTLRPFEPMAYSEPTQTYYQSTVPSEPQKQFQSITQDGPKPFQLNMDPVKPLEPWKPMFSYQPPEPVKQFQPTVTVEPLKPYQTSSSKAEIKEEKIKNTLKEIISEIDTYAEKDKELKDSFEAGKMNGTENHYSYEKIMENSFGTTKQDTQPPGDTWVARLPSCVPPKARPLSLPPDNLMNIMKDIQFSEETTTESYNAYGGDTLLNMLDNRRR